jgi:hypothetical protein
MRASTGFTGLALRARLFGRAIDALELRAVQRDGGFRHLRAGASGAHGLMPAWDGASRAHAARHADLTWRGGHTSPVNGCSRVPGSARRSSR